METLLEQQRSCHEERERIINAMVQVTLQKTTTHREVINADHKQKYLLDRYLNSTNRLVEQYEDKDGYKKIELEDLEETKEIDRVDKLNTYTFNKFYNKLKELQDFHKTLPNEISVPLSVEFNQLLSDDQTEAENFVEFSDEEGYGKFLDLHECYTLYINLNGAEKMDYISYITRFHNLHEIPKERKTGPYRKYINTLLEYLTGFMERTKPLLNLDSQLNGAVKCVLEEWENGNVIGWSKDANSVLTNSGATLDLTPFESWEELAKLGLDRLKSALLGLGLKCGGTLQERAKRLWATKSATSIHRSWVVKTKRDNSDTHKKEMACMEAKIYKLASMVSAQQEATKENVQRKQGRANCEIDESDDEMDGELSDDADADDGVPYNPKNVPLDWDGKPIPFWLYKLHGLNLSYPCEICGNFVYKGPKAFEKHFAEWRHAHGMRCLGIPNTAHFANITKIEDALALWEKLKVKTQAERWQAEDEEYEDSKGNVINRKLYVDLQRQGLL